jgi:RNA recognition motif-containing protein
MGRKLYVGNLPFKVDDAGLAEVFAPAGKVETATVVRDPGTGQARGFGFVEMATDEEAQKAIQMLNQHELEGRALVVNEARPRTERGGSGGGYGGSRGKGGGERRGSGGAGGRGKRW